MLCYGFGVLTLPVRPTFVVNRCSAPNFDWALA